MGGAGVERTRLDPGSRRAEGAGETAARDRTEKAGPRTGARPANDRFGAVLLAPREKVWE